MAMGHKILIIDEDPEFIRATQSVLEKHYQVLCASNGSEAFQMLKRERPDLVILDVMMARKPENLVLSRELRKQRDTRNGPLLMPVGIGGRSGYLHDPLGPKPPEGASVDAWFEKTLNPSQLLSRTESLLRCGTLSKKPWNTQHGVGKERPHRILIVEPDSETALQYESLFRNEGCDVERASSAREAVQKSKDSPFECIIIDVNLPDMAGYNAVSVMKSILPHANVIITAAQNSREQEARIRNEDIFYYYIKSFDREELRLAVQNALIPKGKAV
jgi:DNA-binding response OmpR family regulator